jgi:hypothetical protein
MPKRFSSSEIIKVLKAKGFFFVTQKIRQAKISFEEFNQYFHN